MSNGLDEWTRDAAWTEAARVASELPRHMVLWGVLFGLLVTFFLMTLAVFAVLAMAVIVEILVEVVDSMKELL